MRKFFIIFFCLIIVFSCSRTKKSENTEKPLKSPATTKLVKQSESENNQNKIILKRNSPSKAVQKSTPEGILKNLLPLKTGGNIYPQDFKIGILEPEFGISKADKNILLNIKTFLKGLQKGIVDKKTVFHEDYDSIKRLSVYYFNKASQFKSYRIGNINSTGENTVTVNCRLFGSPGTAEGQLYLKRRGSKWLITDVQIDIKQITKVRKKETFVPNSYSWIMEE